MYLIDIKLNKIFLDFLPLRVILEHAPIAQLDRVLVFETKG